MARYLEPKAYEAEPEVETKSRVLMGSFVAIFISLGCLAAWMALPDRNDHGGFRGPFVSPLTAGDLHGNLTDNRHKRFLQLRLNAMHHSYDADYYESRTSDPLFQPLLRDALIRLISTKESDDVMSEVDGQFFLEEVRANVEPILFPVHVGDTKLPNDHDKASGLRPGLSSLLGTFRRPHKGHVLRVNGTAYSIQLDDGPLKHFTGEERDLKVQSATGETLFLDVTHLKEDFDGQIPVGVKGWVQSILRDNLLVQ